MKCGGSSLPWRTRSEQSRNASRIGLALKGRMAVPFGCSPAALLKDIQDWRGPSTGTPLKSTACAFACTASTLQSTTSLVGSVVVGGSVAVKPDACLPTNSTADKLCAKRVNTTSTAEPSQHAG